MPPPEFREVVVGLGFVGKKHLGVFPGSLAWPKKSEIGSKGWKFCFVIQHLAAKIHELYVHPSLSLKRLERKVFAKIHRKGISFHGFGHVDLRYCPCTVCTMLGAEFKGKKSDYKTTNHFKRCRCHEGSDKMYGLVVFYGVSWPTCVEILIWLMPAIIWPYIYMIGRKTSAISKQSQSENLPVNRPESQAKPRLRWSIVQMSRTMAWPPITTKRHAYQDASDESY